jgi:hypothetical protein
MRRTARILPLAGTLCLASLLVACGSSSPKTGSSGAGRTLTFTSGDAIGTGATPAPADCAEAVARPLGEVASRIYDAASRGSNAGEAVGRVKASQALAGAIAANDRTAASAVLRSLLVNQIARIDVSRGGRPFAGAGSGAAVAPVRGSIPGTDASFVLSVQSARAYMQVAHQVTGAQLVLYRSSRRFAGTIGGPSAGRARRDGPVSYAGRRYQLTSVGGTAYPSGLLRIVLLVPSSAITCPHSLAQARVEALGHVGERIYAEEAGSSYVRGTLRQIEADQGFQRAIAARDSTAIRAAIVRFFGAHIHVVRVRAYAVEPDGSQRFLYDLGGPYVLAPVHGSVRSSGTLVGRFSFAIQDDAGYLRLARLFTGAEVLMRVGSKQVMGSLEPGPDSVPDRGTVAYRGKSYEAYSFSGVAFPSGPLRISLLIPQG